MQASNKIICPSCKSTSVFKTTGNDYKCNYCQINFSDTGSTNSVITSADNYKGEIPKTKFNYIIILAMAIALVAIGLAIFCFSASK